MSRSPACLCFGVVLVLAGAAGAVPADSLAVSAEDSVSVSAVDSLSSGATVDSLMATVSDSTAGGGPADLGPAILDLPRDFSRSVGDAALRRRRHEALDDVLRRTPGVSLRVDGDRGMQPHLAATPLDPGWIEIDVDGIPAQDPSSDESALWDLPAVGLAEVLAPGGRNLSTWGSPHLRIRTEGGLEGRTHLRTRFSSAANESFYRAVSVRTPDADRALRFDFGEWKTDEGARFTTSSLPVVNPDAGRSKMRRFEMGTDLGTDAGRLSLRYGRGTRFFRGTVSSAETIERWNGRLSASLHRESAARRTLLQAYHLDWHVDDETHSEVRDASRRGLRWESLPRDGAGWFAQLEAEWRSARFETVEIGEDTVGEVSDSRRVHWAPGFRGRMAGPLSVTVMADLLHAQNARRDLDFGGGAELEWAVSDESRIAAGARRQLRAPSLLETDGWSTWDTVMPLDSGFDETAGSSWRRQAVGELRTEMQDRLYLDLETAWRGVELSVGADHWRLREGIGWVREGTDAARFVGGLELERTQVRGGLRWRRGLGRGEWYVVGWGHRILGELDRDESRGGGWPLYASFVGAGISHPFFSSHNRIGIEVSSRVTGPRFDDRHVILGVTRDAVRELDLEASLLIRDAELRVSYDNLLDERLEEVLGSFRRGRQLRLSLRWDFFN